MLKTQVKTVYFDIGNVLIFFSHPKMFAQISSCTGLSAEELQNLFFEKRWFHLYETGQIDTDSLFRMLSELSPRSFSLPELLDAASNIFTPNLELWPLIQKLKEQTIRLILLSNISECHFNRISTDYPIFQLFDHRILSYEVGACKPHPQIFQKALSHSHCKPNECFYTDDIPEFVASARKEGLPAELYTDVITLQSHLRSRGCNFLY